MSYPAAAGRHQVDDPVTLAWKGWFKDHWNWLVQRLPGRQHRTVCGCDAGQREQAADGVIDHAGATPAARRRSRSRSPGRVELAPGDPPGVPGLPANPAQSAVPTSGRLARVGKRPYILLSCCISLDGYLDDATGQRLLLSNADDFDRVDAVRAECDAILIGAMTVRRDNPRLLVRSRARREARVARGLPPSPIKVTVTERAQLDACADFFTTGDMEKIVYCASGAVDDALARLGRVATVVNAGQPVDLHRLTEDLYARGVDRLMVEGGGTVHTQFLTAGLADELHLVVAPFFVGDSRARRFVGDGAFPWNPNRRATLAEARQIGDVVLLRYALSTRFGAGHRVAPGA